MNEIDPNTACVACGRQDNPETMLICDSCHQGFHLACFGLATIPEEEEWYCQGCQQLESLTVGQHIVLEMAQPLYKDGTDSHFTQGLFEATIHSLDAITKPGMLRQAQLLVADCPIANSLVYYSSSTFRRLQRVPKETLQVAQQLYQQSSSQLISVTLNSSRWGMVGSPAAAAGKATEAWVAGPDAAQQALAALQQQPPKQAYLLVSSRHKESSRGRANSTADSMGTPQLVLQLGTSGPTTAALGPKATAPNSDQAQLPNMDVRNHVWYPGSAHQPSN